LANRLNGTTFPTWAGNSVLTGYEYDANGESGPFVDLHLVKFGNQIIIHAWGQQYINEVCSISQVSSDSVSSIIKHEDFPWITLITCKGKNEKAKSLKFLSIIKTVQAEIKKPAVIKDNGNNK
jgi:LPXTG-site transpeptidase (sortase) family protein